MELVVGARVGSYEIETVLVRDQTCVTYRAHENDEVVEVTEYLPKERATRGDDGVLVPLSPEFKDAYDGGRSRFLKEARALQNWLQNSGQPPHVTAVRTVFEARGTAYLITEHVEGSSLDEELAENGPKTAAWVWRMLDRFTADLFSAHGADVVHGAITPAHVRVRRDGRPVLVRFGAGRSAVATRTETDDGAPEQMEGYAAIEQYETSEKDPRTDIYALGAVAYKALSGKTPPASPERRKGRSVEPLIAAAPALQDTGLAVAVMAALALEPAARPSDLAAWRVQLGLASPAPEASEVPSPPVINTNGSRLWQTAAVAAIALLVVTAMVLTMVFRRAQLQPGPGDGFKDCAECPEMVVLPSGTFRMGAEEEVEHSESVSPVREVKVAAFALGRFEVTQGQYGAFLDATGRPTDDGCFIRVVDDARDWFDEEWNVESSWRALDFDQDENHPVVCSSWVDATAYVAWLSGLTGHKYRLPSEAEWEFAARAGTATRFYWGDDLKCGYANIMDRSWQGVFVAPRWPLSDCYDRARRTAPVGSFSSNAFGLYDMMGNVWEWTADCWHDDYSNNLPGDGTPWNSDGDCGSRPMRGYSWDNTWESDANVSARQSRAIDYAADTIGFRVARMLE